MGCCSSAERSDDDPQTTQNNHHQTPYQSPANATSSTRAIIPQGAVQVQPASPAGASSTSSPVERGLFGLRGHGLGMGHGHGNSPGTDPRSHRRDPSGQINRPLRLHHQWSSPEPLSRRELERRRVEFFDTRVTGRQETWNAIRMAIETMETDLETAQTIIDAAGVTLPAGDLAKGAYDELGNLYLLPEYCVSDPVNLVTDEEMKALGGGTLGEDSLHDDEDEEGMNLANEGKAKAQEDGLDVSSIQRREEKGKSIAGEMFKVRVRLSDRGGKDLEVWAGKEETCRAIVRRIIEDARLAEGVRIRLALLGKMLKESETLQAQGWTTGLVLNAFVFDRSSSPSLA